MAHCACTIQTKYTDTVHIIHHSADRVLSFLCRLSRAKVGSINDDTGLPPLLQRYTKKTQKSIFFCTNAWLGEGVQVEKWIKSFPRTFKNFCKSWTSHFDRYKSTQLLKNRFKEYAFSLSTQVRLYVPATTNTIANN